MNSKIKHILSVVLAFTLFLTAFVYTAKPVASASSLSSLQQKSQNLKDKIASNKEKINELKQDKEKKEEYLDTLQDDISDLHDQINNLNDQIDIIQGKIDEVEAQIKTLEGEVEKLNEDIATTEKRIKKDERKVKETYEALSARLRSDFMTGSDTKLKLLLSSDSIATLLRRLEMMKLVSENDQKAINDFKAEVIQLEESKNTYEERCELKEAKIKQIEDDNAYLYEQRAELKSKKNELSSNERTLKSESQEVQNTIEKLDKNSKYYQSLVEKDEKAEAAAEAEIDAWIKAHATTVPPTTTAPPVTNSSGATVSQGVTSAPSSSGWMFPCPKSGRYISSGFGYRSASISGWSFHGGVDITGNIYGQPIYASRSGTVIRAEKYSNSGYGHYVIIDHGDGFITLYGHCSSVIVNEGQYVSQGTTIAYAGSTGNSTGPHLHFEVRYNGEKVNPLNYISL